MAYYLERTETTDTVTYETPDGMKLRFNKQDCSRLKGLVERLYELEREKEGENG